MINNSIIICDSKDNTLGEYFTECTIQSEYLLNLNENIKQTLVDGSNCNTVYINDIELSKHTEPSLLIIFSHGSDDYFLKESGIVFFGDFQVKPLCLDSGLVYSNACSVGLGFGKKIGGDNSSFFGYDKTVSVDLNEIKNFIECDIYALYLLLKGKTLEEAKDGAKKKFNEKIDNSSYFAASSLRVARDSIVIYGNTTTSFF